MQVALILLILVLVAVAAAGYAVVVASRRAATARDAARTPGEHVVYRVPPGQDPAALLAALHGHGYEAVSETGPAGIDVVVPCRADDVDARDRVRAVIEEHAPANLEGDPAPAGHVRFTAE